MTDSVVVVPLEDRDRWDAAHRQGGLPSQSWRYAWALSASSVEPRLAVVQSRGARMLMPFYERDWMGNIDIATIVGLSGASISPVSTGPLALWREFARAQGWVAGYIQLSPLDDLTEAESGDELVTSNAVFLLDLGAGDPVTSASTSLRHKIRRAAAGGAVLIEDRAALADALKRLYPSTMQRVGARRIYEFSPESLERWAHDPDALVLGASLEGAVAAVSLFQVAGEHAEFHLHGSTDHGRELTAWLIGNAIRRLMDRGVKTLNLGGGARPHDGLYRFKERFHETPRPLRAVCQIYDHERYEELCGQSGVAASGGWFPAYRAGGSSLPPVTAAAASAKKPSRSR